MREFKAPEKLDLDGNSNIFLAGSIEMGVAELWQDRVVSALADEEVNIFNPRRDDWDSSWEQKIENAQFNEQVNWELAALELANTILLYFDPTTKAPISLLEFGLHTRSEKLIVFCPEGFYRKGNVDIVCEKYGVKQVNSFDDMITAVRVAIRIKRLRF